jgi:hypothetical protein
MNDMNGPSQSPSAPSPHLRADPLSLTSNPLHLEQERKYDIQRSVITRSSLHCICLYCYQGFARMEDLYRHASDGGDGHSRILRENRNRDPRGFYEFFRDSLQLSEAHIDDWTICHTRIPDLFDPGILMELLKRKKGYAPAIALQEAVIMATTLRATCPLCHASFSLHATLKTHFREDPGHAHLVSEPDGKFDTAKVIDQLVGSEPLPILSSSVAMMEHSRPDGRESGTESQGIGSHLREDKRRHAHRVLFLSQIRTPLRSITSSQAKRESGMRLHRIEAKRRYVHWDFRSWRLSSSLHLHWLVCENIMCYEAHEGKMARTVSWVQESLTARI